MTGRNSDRKRRPALAVDNGKLTKVRRGKTFDITLIPHGSTDLLCKVDTVERVIVGKTKGFPDLSGPAFTL